MNDIFDLAPHEACALLPMLTPEQLEGLAADIAARGLREPLTVFVDADGTRSLLDGRNRREACRIARIAPSVREVTSDELGGDPRAYVLGAHLHRRQLSAAQRAAALAMMFPDVNPGPSEASEIRKNLGISGELVRQARVVLRIDRTLLERVLRLDVSLEEAFRHASRAGAMRANVATSSNTRSQIGPIPGPTHSSRSDRHYDRDAHPPAGQRKPPARSPERTPAADDETRKRAVRRLETAVELAWDAGLKRADIVAVVDRVARRRR